MQQVFQASGVADASGGLVLRFSARGGQPMKVSQVTAEMVDGDDAVCSVRLNGGLIAVLVPTGDAAAGDPPIWVQPGDLLTLEWTGAPAGAEGAMVAIYEIGAPA